MKCKEKLCVALSFRYKYSKSIELGYFVSAFTQPESRNQWCIEHFLLVKGAGVSDLLIRRVFHCSF